MNIRLSPSWACVIALTFCHAVSMFPSTVGIVTLVATVGIAVLERYFARRGL